MTEIHDERRFAPPVRGWRGNYVGPTAQMHAYVAYERDREAFARLLWTEGWQVPRIADYLGATRRWVRSVVAEEVA